MLRRVPATIGRVLAVVGCAAIGAGPLLILALSGSADAQGDSPVEIDEDGNVTISFEIDGEQKEFKVPAAEGEDATTALPPIGDHGDFHNTDSDAALLTIQALIQEAGIEGDGGARLEGQCGGFALSFDDKGKLIDAAYRDPAAQSASPIRIWPASEFGETVFDKDNPFKVHSAGDVIYRGTTVPVFQNHNWEINSTFALDTGGDDNPAGEQDNFGAVEVGETIPVRFTGLFKVDGFIEDGEDRCEGSGWVEFVGPFPALTPAGAVAAVFAAGGFAGILFNARPALTF